MPKLVLVEDDATMSEMVAYNLRRHGLEVSTAADGLAGMRMAKERGVSMAILDVMLPGSDGLTIAEELRRARPHLPILMLTARSEEHAKLAGFAAGADDYLTKPFSMDELVARVKALLRRAEPRDDEAEPLVFGDLRLAVGDHRCWVGDGEIELRPKEFALLATLAAEPGRLFSRVELAERVWGYSHLGATRTIDTHVKNVRRKVEDVSSFRYIDTVRGIGYRFRVRPKAGAPA